ncbi:MAG: DUF126 domain-containing protein [Gemmatimonadota bacterium]|nr:DUF126 domain-containing protein [Gemmatimonadota bacterium]
MGGVIRGTPVGTGRGSGEVVGSTEPLSFWGGYDAGSGEIIDRRHPLGGRRAARRVLAVPATRGSSTTTAVLLEAVRRGTAPAAILTRGVDRFLSLAAIVADELYGAELPVVALDSDDFGLAVTAFRADVREDGRVTLDHAPPT